jgi:hypothetical protein
VEILFPMWATQGWLQPFRFVELPEASKNALEASLLSFIKSGGQETAAAPAVSSPPDLAQPIPTPQPADNV